MVRPLPRDPRFERALDNLFVAEGGYVDDPADSGGATKYGVSLRFLLSEGQVDADRNGFADFDLDMDGDIDADDIRRLTRADAAVLYRQAFWDRMGCASWPYPIGEMLFDQGVNGGLTAARKLLQSAIVRAAPSRRLAIDGRIGPVTRAGLQFALAEPGIGMERVTTAYREEAKVRYRDLARRFPKNKRFLHGWLARADRLGRA